MTIKFGDIELQEDIDKFVMQVESIDMEKVKRNTVRRSASQMSRMVRQAVFESSIRSPAKSQSPFEQGDGPAIITQDAWIARKISNNRYTVGPHPAVAQRAHVLNFGYPGKIYPKGDKPFGFEVNGVPTFAEWVEGPDATHYWRKAVNRMKRGGKLEMVAREELKDQFFETKRAFTT